MKKQKITHPWDYITSYQETCDEHTKTCERIASLEGKLYVLITLNIISIVLMVILKLA
jgi:hypothetical protein